MIWSTSVKIIKGHYTSSLAVRLELREAVEGGLRDTGVYERLVPGTKALVDKRPDYIERGKPGEVRPVDDEKLLELVASKVPTDEWPVGMHKAVAESLGISRGLAYRAITTLLASKRITKPPQREPVLST